MSRKRRKRSYGEGTIYQRSDGMYVGIVEGGTNANGKRRRLPVYSKDYDECARKLRDKQRALALNMVTDVSPRATITTWAKEWLPLRESTQRPNSYNADASAVRRWIVPTIGHVRFDALQPAHVRAVEKAQRTAGRSSSTMARTHSVLMSLLRAARQEGYPVTDRVLDVPAPALAVSDRDAMAVEHAVKVLEVAAANPEGQPDASRWVAGLLNGVRQAEALGLTWSAVDFESDVLRLSWQLQPIPYKHGCTDDKGIATCGRKRAGSCPQRRFRIPDGYATHQLHGRLHLVQPKTKKGARELPMVPWMRTSLHAWWEACGKPEDGLVWPSAAGRPVPSKDDDAAWYALQDLAGVRHPTRLDGDDEPARYTMHEMRHTTATLLRKAGVDPAVIAAILGQTKLVESYVHVDWSPQAAAALQLVADQLALPGQSAG